MYSRVVCLSGDDLLGMDWFTEWNHQFCRVFFSCATEAVKSDKSQTQFIVKEKKQVSYLTPPWNAVSSRQKAVWGTFLLWAIYLTSRFDQRDETAVVVNWCLNTSNRTRPATEHAAAEWQPTHTDAQTDNGGHTATSGPGSLDLIRRIIAASQTQQRLSLSLQFFCRGPMPETHSAHGGLFVLFN